LKRNPQLLLAIALIPAVAGLAACASKIRYPNFYVLNLPTPVPAGGQPRPVLGSVAVREFGAPSFLRGGPIVYRPSPEQLGFYEYHRWAVDPRRTVTGAVIQELESRGIFRSVDLFDGHGAPDCLVTGAIDHLEEVDQGSNVIIEVSLSAQLTNLRTGEVLWQGNSSQTTKLEQRSVPGIVAEMSRDLANAVERLVSSMQNRLTVTSALLGR